MCNYVEALTPFMLQWISCSVQDAGECTIDPSCTYNITDGCNPAEEIAGRLLFKAEEVKLPLCAFLLLTVVFQEFAKEIEDEDARDLYLLVVDCRLRRSEDTCHGNLLHSASERLIIAFRTRSLPVELRRRILLYFDKMGTERDSPYCGRHRR